MHLDLDAVKSITSSRDNRPASTQQTANQTEGYPALQAKSGSTLNVLGAYTSQKNGS